MYLQLYLINQAKTSKGFIPFLVLICLLFLQSCSSSNKETALITNDASFVVYADIGSILDKSKLTSFSFNNIKSYFNKRGRTKSPASIIESVITNFNKTGISKNGRAFYYQSKLKKRYDLNCFVFRLSSASDFESFLKEYGQDLLGNVEIKSNQMFSSAKFKKERDLILAWNSNNAILIMPERLHLGSKDKHSFLTDLFTLTEDNQLISNESFSSFHSKTNDVGAWINLEKMKKEINNSFKNNSMLKQIGESVELSLNFNDENIRFETSSNFPEEYIAKMKKAIGFASVDETLLKYRPDSSVVTAALRINPSEFMNFITILDRDIKRSVNKLDNKLENEFGISVKELTDALGENSFFNLSGIETEKHLASVSDYKTNYETGEIEKFEEMEMQEEDVYKVQAIFEITNTGVITTMLDSIVSLSRNELVKKSNKNYVFPKSEIGKIFIRVNSDKLIISNDSMFIEHVLEGTRISNESILVNNKGLIAYLSAKPVIEMYADLYSLFGKSEETQITADLWSDLIKGIRVYNSDNTSNTFEIIFNNSDNNSLYQIIECNKLNLEKLKEFKNKKQSKRKVIATPKAEYEEVETEYTDLDEVEINDY